MNELKGIEITPLDLTNGAVTDYTIKVNSFVHLKNRDRISITTPPNIGFGPQGISCAPAKPSPIGVTQTSCENIDTQTFVVTFDEVNQEEGDFEVIVSGMKNPPNFRKTGLFSDIFFETFDFKNIQKLSDYDNLWVQTNKPGTITDYRRFQTSEGFGVESTYEISFTPLNPIGKDGMIQVTWTDQVKFLKDKQVCTVQTSQVYKNECVFDYDNRMVKIFNVFSKELNAYSGPVKIILEKFMNPNTNLGIKPFTVETFDDNKKQFPIDTFEYEPLLQCNYPCRLCTEQKDFCVACWLEDLTSPRYLMQASETESTCKNSCDDGYTSDGNPLL